MLFMIFNAILTVICLLGTYFNTRQLVWGFALWIFTNSVYALMDIFMYHNYFRALLFLVQTGMCIMGIWNWNKLEKERLNDSK